MSEDFIMSPDEMQKKLKASKRIVLENDDDEDGSEEQDQPQSSKKKKSDKQESKPEKTVERSGQKFRILGEKAKVELESGGRFDLPSEIYLEDYDSADITALVTSREDDILETLIAIMDKSVNNEGNSEKFSTGDATPEEFFEMQIALKLQFDSVWMTYRWMCEEENCQDHLPQDKKKHSEMELDLSTVNYISIENVEEEFRESLREALKNEDLKNQYLSKKYPDGVPGDWTIESEINQVKIKEPINIVDDKGHHYKYRFMRMKDLVNSYRRVSKQYDPLIRQINSRKYSGITDQDKIKYQREEEIKEVQKKKAQQAILASQAMCLVEFDGDRNLSDDRKVEIFSAMPRKANFELMNAWDSCKYGIRHEFDATCNHCGSVSRRSLQRGLSPIDLIPVSDDRRSDSVERLQRNPSVAFYFG